jgi:putative glutamine amidotransferase
VEPQTQPLIAVTTTTEPVGSRGLPGVVLNVQYLQAVRAVGGVPVLITPAHPDDAMERLLRLCQGLLLTGGEDVDPSRYGQEAIPECGVPNAERDRMELAAVRVAMDRGMPVLAICRGLQVLNVALGGTLYQDLPSQLGGDLLHEQTAPVDRRWHHATVTRDSGLERIFGARELFINSFHHQGIDRLGEGLLGTVRAEDGLIEGIEGAEGSGWLYGVQWHPERGEADLAHDARDPDRRLFWAFVEAAREYAAAGAQAAAGVV